MNVEQTSAPQAAAAALPGWLSKDLARVEDLLLATAGASAHPLVSEPSTHLIKAGGKRLRPALVLLSAYSGETDRHSTDLAAAAVELVHIATLYHDDVMDETETRRGAPTAHSKWGIEVAVLAGDFLFACGSTLGAEAAGEVPGLLARAIAEVCEGQIMETAALDDPNRSLDAYFEVITRKTASLFRAACELGSATSGADANDRARLSRYGLNVGLAFQVVDDLLDIVGDPRTTGKKLGTDLRKGVFTFPVLLARERDRSLSQRLDAGERDLGVLLPSLVETGAIADALEMATSYARRAHEALDDIKPGEYARVLGGLLDGVLAQIPR